MGNKKAGYGNSRPARGSRRRYFTKVHLPLSMRIIVLAR